MNKRPSDMSEEKKLQRPFKRSKTMLGTSALVELPVSKNDYSQHFVDSGMRPQNFIRERGREERCVEYPKLRRLITLKNEAVEKHSTPPMYANVNLKTFDMKSLGHHFDVILVDPPWQEYADRCPGTTDRVPWKFKELENLRVQDVANSQSFLFLWVGSVCDTWNKGRELMKKWGFRRCEVIAWLKTNKQKTVVTDERGNNTEEVNAYDSFCHSADGIILQPTIEHCLMGIKGTVRRSTDGHIIHSNVDTDVIISENPPYGSTGKPVELYDIIERFCLGRKRLELFGELNNVRRGWVTLGEKVPPGMTYSAELYGTFFKTVEDRYIPFDQRVELLRPKSPVIN